MSWEVIVSPGVLLPTAILLPACCALAAALGGLTACRLVAGSAAPAVAAAALLPDGCWTALSWVLLHARLGIDPTGRVFLLFTSVLWLLSGVYGTRYLGSDPRKGRFYVFYGLALSGNLALIVAWDMVSFFTGFAVMSFASYGLVVHSGEPEALRAGRVYLALVVIGEVLLFSGLVLVAAEAGAYDLVQPSPSKVPPAALLLLVAGFGIKAGALPLHVWLPLAHSAAPTPASAVLSGAMINAGLLGWVRFLAPAAPGTEAWGAALLAAGAAAAFYGVGVGLTQSNPKTILAYSSISQMGLITTAFGIALFEPGASGPALRSVETYAMHHGFAKGALFLGVGLLAAAGSPRQARLAWFGLVLAALSLAGAPFTSGAFAKAWVKAAAGMLPERASGALSVVLPLAAVGTTLLLGRFLYVMRNRPPAPAHPARAALWVPWALLLAPTVLIPAGAQVLEPGPVAAVGAFAAAIWPVAAGAAIVVLAAAAARTGKRMPRLPAGDLVDVYGWAWRGLVGIRKRVRGVEWRSVKTRRTIEHLRRKAFTAGDALDALLTDGRLQSVLLLLLIGLLYLSGVLPAAF
jgi:formate hydrogenlyase subunit 3/multisubunit Na+/H+ antiporter MnhD subunit